MGAMIFNEQELFGKFAEGVGFFFNKFQDGFNSIFGSLPVIGTSFVAKGGTASSVTTSLILFLVAALGGFGLFSFHLRKLALPIWIMVVHALVAVLAFVILLVAALS